MQKVTPDFFKFLSLLKAKWLILSLFLLVVVSAKPYISSETAQKFKKPKSQILYSVHSPPDSLPKLKNQTLLPQERFYFETGLTSDSIGNNPRTFTATLANGQALPTWLKFNPTNLSFRGTAPASQVTLKIQLTATHQNQPPAQTTFTVAVRPTELVAVTGELKKWHKITLTIAGPLTSETDSINPFLDYRLNVIFKKGTRRVVVPGYYTANGNSAKTGVNSGNKWRAHFTPDETGEWTYSVSFRTGPNIAVSTISSAGTQLTANGLTGSFTVTQSDKTGRDFRAKGRLQYTGQHYLQFAETQEYFLKGGAGSPENFLAYRDFDNTYSQNPAADYTKTYAAHIADWQPGDPVWRGNKGKGIIGALNYLASKGMNSVYFLTLNVNGDGKDVWPWVSPTIRDRYDVSKLAQWETVFSHMDKLGIMLHVITQEQENDQLLNGGSLKIQRKLYYRELIARFGHHLGITWNLGEENTNTTSQRKIFSYYFRQIDPYNSPIDIHSFPSEKDAVFGPLLGYKNLEGASLQIAQIADVHQQTQSWVNQSAASGRNWVVTLDEIGPSNRGALPDSKDSTHNPIRKQALWGHLMAGGAGIEWYFGYREVHSDLTAQDWRSRDRLWELTENALYFFNNYLPYWQMQSADSLTSSPTDYCFAKAGQVYAIYLPQGGTTNLNTGTAQSIFQVYWYNPRTPQGLQKGSVKQITGSGEHSIGLPPQNSNQDWVCLVTANSPDFLKKEIVSAINQVTPDVPEVNLVVTVYPNPVQEHVELKFNTQPSSAVEVTVLEFNGRVVLKTAKKINSDLTMNLNISRLKPDIYILRVKQGTTLYQQKLVKN